MQLFFQMEAQDDYSKRLQDSFIAQNVKAEDEQNDYIHRVLIAFIANMAAVDETIEKASVKWHINRMAKVDFAVLRLAVTEIKYLKDDQVPAQVAINEAVNIAKKYGTEESGKFVNGVLGKIAD